jgi:hypothetical protein
MLGYVKDDPFAKLALYRGSTLSEEGNVTFLSYEGIEFVACPEDILRGQTRIYS